MNFFLMRADLEKATGRITRVVGSYIVEPKAKSGQAPEAKAAEAIDPAVLRIQKILKKVLKDE